MKFDIVRRRYLWFTISALIIIPGLISMVMQGFNLSIDFTGGTLFDLRFAQPVSVAQVRDVLQDYHLENSTIQLAGTTTGAETATNVFIRTKVLSDDERKAVQSGLSERLGNYDVLRIEKVGAIIGSELTRQALLAVGLASVLMIIYITFRFEFKFAVSGILALLHDVLLTMGVFSLLQKEVDASFVAAILTIIGYSINDTIVIFDRIRENLKAFRKNDNLFEMVDP
jgi:preprotein translocase subunit SecF